MVRIVGNTSLAWKNHKTNLPRGSQTVTSLPKRIQSRETVSACKLRSTCQGCSCSVAYRRGNTRPAMPRCFIVPRTAMHCHAATHCHAAHPNKQRLSSASSIRHKEPLLRAYQQRGGRTSTDQRVANGCIKNMPSNVLDFGPRTDSDTGSGFKLSR